MKVFIARGTEDVGSFPEEQLPQLARSGKIKRTDTYWHDGMDTWEPVSELLGRSVWEPGGGGEVARPDVKVAARPSDDLWDAARPPEKSRSTPRSTPLDWRIIGGAAAGLVIAVIVLGLFVIKPDAEPIEPVGTLRPAGSAPAPRGNTSVVRDKLADELQQRVDRLPKTPAPPLNTYYFDVSIDVTATGAMRAPYAATINGRENVVDPETGTTISQTEFAVTTDFAAGEWVYKTYRATTLDSEGRITSMILHDSNRLAPPVLIAMLGLKTADHFSSTLPPQK